MRKSSFKSRSGVTMVEILVAMAISVVVLGTIAGIYDTSMRISRRSILQDQVFAEATLITSTIERGLQEYVPSNEERWTAKEVSFLAGDGQLAKSRRIWSDAESGHVSMEVFALDAPASRPAQSAVGMEKQTIQTSVTFQFARDFEGIKPVWSESVPDAEHPRVVRYEVTAKLLDEKQPREAIVSPVTLSGAVALVD